MLSAGSVDEGTVGQRLALLAAVVALAAVVTGSAPGASRPLPNWAAPQIATVVAHRLMAKSVRKFRPNKVTTRQTLANLAVGLQQQLSTVQGSSDSSTGTTTTGTTGTTTTNGTTTAPSVSNPAVPV